MSESQGKAIVKKTPRVEVMKGLGSLLGGVAAILAVVVSWQTLEQTREAANQSTAAAERAERATIEISRRAQASSETLLESVSQEISLLESEIELLPSQIAYWNQECNGGSNHCTLARGGPQLLRLKTGRLESLRGLRAVLMQELSRP